MADTKKEILYNFQATFIEKNPEKHVVEQEKSLTLDVVKTRLIDLNYLHHEGEIALQNIIIAPVPQ